MSSEASIDKADIETLVLVSGASIETKVGEDDAAEAGGESVATVDVVEVGLVLLL